MFFFLFNLVFYSLAGSWVMVSLDSQYSFKGSADVVLIAMPLNLQHKPTKCTANLIKARLYEKLSTWKSIISIFLSFQVNQLKPKWTTQASCKAYAKTLNQCIGRCSNSSKLTLPASSRRWTFWEN